MDVYQVTLYMCPNAYDSGLPITIRADASVAKTADAIVAKTMLVPKESRMETESCQILF